MIEVTRLDNRKMIINVEKIYFLEETPDTVITFTNNDRLMVREPASEISRKIVEYQRTVHAAGFFESNTMAAAGTPLH